MELYTGRTDTQSVKSALCSVETHEINSVSDEELNSSRNVSRDNCRSFEPWTPARDAFATAFFGQCEPHLNERWAMSDAVAKTVLRQDVVSRAGRADEPDHVLVLQVRQIAFGGLL